MKPIPALTTCCLLLARQALANVEKTIFLGPRPVSIPLASPTLEDLHIDTLNPQNPWSLRTQLTAKFPSATSPEGYTTWLLLDSLTEGQRYEVRVCWPATQPTAFTLRTYELDTVFETPQLITSLNNYSLTRQPAEDSPARRAAGRHDTKERHASVLFLEILAAADYFTTDATLMQNPPPVDVDIILDPFLLNVLPRSLLPTVGYILVVAVAAILASQWTLTKLTSIIASANTSKSKKTQ
ncbi:hypothetical protein QBC47DRAFT_397408 [Echria macrotheca]|uniref:Uncharacterized protein n=1 Tax=Echria macrotheca TaxID=438768 RepID=A0AAJ0FAJ2_9PEZI|nr:hypothetical protein QBC47DRAFT_397408 [Echria macrotheca]